MGDVGNLPKFDKKEVRTIRGKKVTFASRTLKNGKTAYYRDGKKVESYYQKRLAKGVLNGLTIAEARGHPFGAYSGKLLTRREIQAQEEFHIGAWAEPPRAFGRGKEQSAYYMKISVTSESVKIQNRPGSPTGEEEACIAVTLKLRNPFQNDQDGFTYQELTRNFSQIATFTLQKYGLEACTGNLQEDVISIWRHSRR